MHVNCPFLYKSHLLNFVILQFLNRYLYFFLGIFSITILYLKSSPVKFKLDPLFLSLYLYYPYSIFNYLDTHLSFLLKVRIALILIVLIQLSEVTDICWVPLTSAVMKFCPSSRESESEKKSYQYSDSLQWIPHSSAEKNAKKRSYLRNNHFLKYAGPIPSYSPKSYSTVYLLMLSPVLSQSTLIVI